MDKIDNITATVNVYARAKPSDKITIVRSLQRQGHVCSMTGDGVNDAPALKQANIGVAMGSGTDVAKSAADMVLLDDNFVTIVAAIEQGRTLYNNIQKFVFYLLSTNVSEVLFILIAVILGYQTPLLPIQILWLNLATDGAPAIALAVELAEPNIMDEGPRPKTEPIIEKVMVTGIVIQTIVLTSCTLFTYVYGLSLFIGSWDGVNSSLTPDELDLGIAKARTMSILYIVFAELLRAYSSRSLRVSIIQLGVFSNIYMQYSVFVAIISTVVIANTPWVMDVFSLHYLSLREWAFVVIFAFVPFFVDELTKYFYRLTGFGKRPRAQTTRPPAQTAEISTENEQSQLLRDGKSGKNYSGTHETV